MVSLSDRLDYIVGAKAASPLDEVFGIRTVDDLLRHYPRSYVEGATVRGADDEPPPEGEHVTLVDVITEAALLSIKSRPRDKLFRVTLGSGRGKVTATFFHRRSGSPTSCPRAPASCCPARSATSAAPCN